MTIDEKAKILYDQVLAVNPFYKSDPDTLMARCIQHIQLKEAKHVASELIK